MSKSLDTSLQQIARGTTIVFTGVIVSMALNFLLRVVLVRYTSLDEYGVYTLALTIIGMIATLAMLGLDEGASRYIAYFLGRSDGAKVRRIVASTVRISLAMSLVGAVGLFLFSGPIATTVFHSGELAGTLRVISLAIPLTVLIQILTSITRGFNVSILKVLFNDLLKPLSFLVLLLGIIALGWKFDAIIAGYVASMAITVAAFAVVAARWFSRRPVAGPDPGRSTTRDLVRFSVPLLSVSLLLLLMSQATTLLLGFFRTTAEVGMFDIALTMGSLLLTVLNSLGYIYTPTASKLYGQGDVEELKRSYVVSTRWGYIGTLPILFLVLVFPGAIVDLLFGSRYAGVALGLQILCLGYIVNPLTGPNYHTLIAMGRTRAIVGSFLANAAVNLTLSVLLIPPLGVIGAAIAVSLSTLAANLLLSVRLYQLLKIHPLTRNYLVSVVASLALLAVYFAGLRYLAIAPTLTVAAVSLVAYLAACVSILIALKAVDKEDLALLAAVEKRLGLHIVPVKAL